MNFKTVLFDFDGTIADTNRLISESHFVVMGFSGSLQARGNGPIQRFQSEIRIDRERQDELVARYREVMLETW